MPVKLKTVKFNSVSSLFIFAEREGGERVALSKLALGGGLVGGTDVAAIKKLDHDHD